MKVIALLLILALSTVYATTTSKKAERGSQLITLFEEYPGTYLTMFYDHNSDRGRISKARNDKRLQISFLGKRVWPLLQLLKDNYCKKVKECLFSIIIVLTEINPFLLIDFQL